MKNSQCIVIGAGVNGLVSALTLKQRGYDVLIIDNNKPSASQAGAGILSPLPPWAYADKVQKLAAMGAQMYPDLLTQLGNQCDYTPSGMAVICDNGKNNLTTHYQRTQWFKQNATQPIDTKQVSSALKASLSPINLLPTIASINPIKLINCLKNYLINEIIEDEMIDFSLNKHQINHVNLKNNTAIACEMLVLTAGAWSGQFFSDKAITVKPIRGQLLGFDAQAIALNHIILDESDGMYCLQRPNKKLIIGSTLEDVGFNNSNSIGGIRQLWKKAIAFFPKLKQYRPTESWSGLRPFSSNQPLLIARHPSINNLFLNTGHFRYGLTMAPASAQQLIDIIEDKPMAGNLPYSSK